MTAAGTSGASQPYTKMTVLNLKEALKSRGLNPVGTKPELVKRLEEADREAAQAEEAVRDEAAAEEPPAEATQSAAVDDGNAADAASAPATGADAQASAPARQPVAQPPATTATPGESLARKETRGDALDARLKRFGTASLSFEDRMEHRQKRFKAEAEKEERKGACGGTRMDPTQRAQRFNVACPELEAEKRAARAQRFSSGAPSGAAKSPRVAVPVSELASLIHKKK